jgi:NAD(P)-dependent dehydrogenase (short-subunit alcohol dehydrogenase family)
MDPVYGGSKHFVVGFVRSIAPQLSERGVTINAVCPAAVDTPMIDSARERMRAAGTPLLRPEEVAEAVLLAARSGDTGQAWVCIPGRAPERHEFPSLFETS